MPRSGGMFSGGRIRKGMRRGMGEGKMQNEIERFYDEEYEEWERLAWHLPEFEVTKRYMDQYIGGQKKVLDVGGST